MSGTLSTNYFTGAEITSNTTTRTSTTIGNKMIRRQVGGQFWTLKLTTTNLDQDEMAELYAFLVKQEGTYESFSFVPPIHGNTRGTSVSGIPLVLNTYAAGLTSIRANGGSGTLKTGDFFKFSNHDKVYMLTADVNQDASSEDTFNFFPHLATAVDNTTTIAYNNVPFKVMLTTDESTFKTQADGSYQLEFTVREDI